LVVLWRSRRPLRRALVWAYALLFVMFMVTSGAKIYYLAGAYVPLLAAGAIAVDARLTRSGRSLRLLSAAVAVSAAVALPIVLPVLPSSRIGWTYGVNTVPGDSVGWPELVRTVD